MTFNFCHTVVCVFNMAEGNRWYNALSVHFKTFLENAVRDKPD